MKAGDLYSMQHAWLSPMSNAKWKSGDVGVYLGKEKIYLKDSKDIVNYLFFVNGEKYFADRSFLRLLKKVETQKDMLRVTCSFVQYNIKKERNI